MPRSDEAAMWYSAVYQAVQNIPYGKVTSYGHIATLLGHRKSETNVPTGEKLTMKAERPRQVGICLKYLPDAADQPDARYNGDTVPWQRVINSKGIISVRGVGGAARQEVVLAQEGVEVSRGSLGERTVDLSTYGWFPNDLPGDELEDEE